MAQVAQDTALQTRIDYYLDYLLQQWDGLSEVNAEWDEWDDESRRTFAANWAVPRDRLAQLHTWAAQGLLTAEQRSRYERLCAIAASQNTLLERLMGAPRAGRLEH
jgi:hypothetical protein